jgi:hypothetical protein
VGGEGKRQRRTRKLGGKARERRKEESESREGRRKERERGKVLQISERKEQLRKKKGTQVYIGLRCTLSYT